MTTSQALITLTEELQAMLGNPFTGKPSVVIDERGTDVTVNEPIGSLTVTSSGDRSSVYGYADIDNFVLKPYADNVDSWVMGDVERLQTTDNWFADLVIGGDVGRADLEQFDYSDLAVYGNVDRLELFDSRDSDLAFYGHTDQADITWVQDTALTFSEIGRWLELDGVNDSVVQVGEADDAFVEIEDSEDLTVSVFSADDTEFELGNVDHLDLTIAHGDVMIEGDEVADSSIQTGDGHDYLYLEEVTGTTIHTGAGHDDVALEDADQVAVHTGEGNDFLSFTTADPTAQLAYNLGEGRDFAYIDGGNTLGNLLDGDNDTIVFNTEAGGNHEVMADAPDQLYLQTETGLWDANLVDFVDQGGQDGVAEWGDFSLTMHTPTPAVDDLFLG